jgi:hypothetical protein
VLASIGASSTLILSRLSLKPCSLLFDVAEHTAQIREAPSGRSASAAKSKAKEVQGGPDAWTAKHVVVSSVPIRHWAELQQQQQISGQSVAEYLMLTHDKPMVIRGGTAITEQWPAYKLWQNWTALSERMSDMPLFPKVKKTKHWLVYDMDPAAPLARASTMDMKVHYEHVDLPVRLLTLLPTCWY